MLLLITLFVCCCLINIDCLCFLVCGFLTNNNINAGVYTQLRKEQRVRRLEYMVHWPKIRSTNTKMHANKHRDTSRHRYRLLQTYRQYRHRYTDTQTDRQTDRHTRTHTYTQTQTYRHRYTHITEWNRCERTSACPFDKKPCCLDVLLLQCCCA
jgi:hypothetical protein